MLVNTHKLFLGCNYSRFFADCKDVFTISSFKDNISIYRIVRRQLLLFALLIFTSLLTNCSSPARRLASLRCFDRIVSRRCYCRAFHQFVDKL